MKSQREPSAGKGAMRGHGEPGIFATIAFLGL